MDITSSRIDKLEPSMTLAITAQANAMKAEGKDICSFGAGEPDHDTPDHIKIAAVEALHNGKTKYAPTAGIPELRSALTEKLLLENHLEYTPNQILVSTGAKQSCFNAMMAVCEDGDEIVIPAPYWTSYPDMAHMAGAEPVIVETKRENGWKMTPEDFEEIMTPKTKMVIINSPNNPTGAVYSKDELEALGEVAASEDIVILSDEIYEKLIFDGIEHTSIASINEELYNLTVTVNGFSKAYSMTGWRIGYAAGPQKIIDAMEVVQSHSTSNATTFAQYGALAALTGDQAFINDVREEFDMRRHYMMSRLQSIPNVKIVEPKGAFYFLVDIEEIGIKSINCAEKLLSKHEVAVVPGAAFGANNTIRFSYATSLDVIKYGLDRFEDFCRSH